MRGIVFQCQAMLFRVSAILLRPAEVSIVIVINSATHH